MSIFSEISAKTLKACMENETFKLIDVREPSEYNDGHIKNSINVPLSALLGEIDKSNFELDTKFIMICRAGARSRLACEKLFHDGFSFKLYNLDGGIISWQNNGYEVEK